MWVAASTSCRLRKTVTRHSWSQPLKIMDPAFRCSTLPKSRQSQVCTRLQCQTEIATERLFQLTRTAPTTSSNSTTETPSTAANGGKLLKLSTSPATSPSKTWASLPVAACSWPQTTRTPEPTYKWLMMAKACNTGESQGSKLQWPASESLYVKGTTSSRPIEWLGISNINSLNIYSFHIS